MRRQALILGAILLSLLAGAYVSSARAGEAAGDSETKEQRDARMQWWRDARFGMFIHWGLYAIPAGEWKGKPVQGIGEWIMNSANIPVEEYEQLAKQFNPVKYDPAEWVRIAKQAGMKYLVITSKHHDGFCLFETDTTAYDVGRCHAVRQGPAAAAGGRVPQAGDPLLRLLLDHGLAPSGSIPRERRAIQSDEHSSGTESRVHGFHEAAAQGSAGRLQARGTVVRWRVAQMVHAGRRLGGLQLPAGTGAAR